jgi:hypothetical protein
MARSPCPPGTCPTPRRLAVRRPELLQRGVDAFGCLAGTREITPRLRKPPKVGPGASRVEPGLGPAARPSAPAGARNHRDHARARTSGPPLGDRAGRWDGQHRRRRGPRHALGLLALLSRRALRVGPCCARVRERAQPVGGVQRNRAFPGDRDYRCPPVGLGVFETIPES